MADPLWVQYLLALRTTTFAFTGQIHIILIGLLGTTCLLNMVKIPKLS